MPEQTREVKTFRVDYICDACGKAPIEPTGSVFFTDPIQYEYKRPACGRVTVKFERYPAVIREDVR